MKRHWIPSPGFAVSRNAVGPLLAGVLYLVPMPSWGQTHVLSQRFGNSTYQSGLGIAVDAARNAIVTGRFQGTVDFGGGPLTSVGSTDIFIAKYDANGVHLWSRQFGDGASEHGLGVAVDSAGNVIVVGYFEGTIDLGGDTLTTGGGSDMFLAKYDASGAHLWSRRFGDTGLDACNDVVFDGAGDLLVIGHFQNTVDFGGGALTSAGGLDIVVAKYDNGGSHIWSQRLGGTGTDLGMNIATGSGGNVVVTGMFEDTVDFGGGPLTSAGVDDIFVAKYDAGGTHVWSQRFGDGTYDYGYGTAVDGVGAVVVTGSFLGTIDFGGGLLTSAGNFDIFVAKFDAGGSHVWSKRFGDIWLDDGIAIAVDGTGHVVVTGNFSGTVDFGGGPLMSGNNSDDVFVAKYDAAGTHVWSQGFGDPTCGLFCRDLGEGITVDSAGGVFVTGSFEGTVDFGGGALTSAGQNDIFVAEYASGTPTAITDPPESVNRGFTLDQNHPNPFNPTTRIGFSIDRRQKVRLAIYDTTGGLVVTLLDGHLDAGSYSKEWNGRNGEGIAVASGVYYYQLTTGRRTLTRKAVLLK